MTFTRLFTAVCSLFVLSTLAYANENVIGLCKFNLATLQFDGDSRTQTKCLLRRVKQKGTGSVVQDIPSVILERVGKNNVISSKKFIAYAKSKKISLSDVGGKLFDQPVLQASSANKHYYFVIHDTASPVGIRSEGFPENMNSADWVGNVIKAPRWEETAPKVHAITNRVGDSRTFREFFIPSPEVATKLEMCNSKVGSRFIQVENIQPRLKPTKESVYAYESPDPGFSDLQLERLALLYVSASTKLGKWLVPAFHFNVDSGTRPRCSKKHAHDDPQNFDLARWGAAIVKVLNDIDAVSVGASNNTVDVELLSFATEMMDCGSDGCVSGCVAKLKWSNKAASDISGASVGFPIAAPRNGEHDVEMWSQIIDLKAGQSIETTLHTIQSECVGVDFSRPNLDCDLEQGGKCNSTFRLN